MGKPKGDGARSKNRPSSSSLAASLLPTSSVPAVGFGGYLGSSRVQPSTLNSEEPAHTESDSEVVLHIKRLGRKDMTTKLKALAALDELFKQKPSDDIMQIIPQWIFHYKKLSVDYNREVRRSTHETMSSLVMTVRKGLGPHLKSLMGPWWVSQFDPSAEVALAARRSFESAFPQPERRLDALMLCISEIFIYLDENLKLSVQALSDKSLPADELEDMQEQIISSSLLSMTTLLDIILRPKSQTYDDENIPAEQKGHSKARAATISCAENMFSTHNNFLDFLKAKGALVRSAAYTILTSYMKHVPHVFNDGNLKIMAPALLGSFQEKDATCHSSMWEMFIYFSSKFLEAWALCNIQKIVLNRFWQFLRNGCYGSKQISYPYLVRFLENVPVNTVDAEHFVFDFLQNLWAGRNSQHLSAADSSAFFSSFKQCFIWFINNKSRCSSGESSRVILLRLIKDILINDLCHDFLQLSLSRERDERSQSVINEIENNQLSADKALLAAISRFPSFYQDDLGRCIVDILLDISLNHSNLLDHFCAFLKSDCLEVLQQGELIAKFEMHVEQIISFFAMLDQAFCQTTQLWPLSCLARPLVTESYSLIRDLDSPCHVNFMLGLVQIFGPANIFSGGGEESILTDEKSKLVPYLETFKYEFLPWCLDGNPRTSDAKLDLLIAFIQESCFSDQWFSIINFIMQQNQLDEVNAIERVSHFELLGMLLGKMREGINNKKMESLQRVSSAQQQLRLDVLNSAAVSAACDLYERGSNVYFLCSALGGSIAEDEICFLSGEAVGIILQHVLKSLASILLESNLDWARFAYSLLADTDGGVCNQELSTLARYKMAQHVLEVIKGSFFCFKRLGDDSALSSVLATLFIIELEYSMSSLLDEITSDDIEDKFTAGFVSESGRKEVDMDSQEYLKLNLMETVKNFREASSSAVWGSLNTFVLSKLAELLAHTVRFVLFESKEVNSEKMSLLCCHWVVDVMKAICHDDSQLQNFLDLLLSEGECWPLWVVPCFQNETGTASMRLGRVVTGDAELENQREVKHLQFITFVEKLITTLGYREVLAVPDHLGSDEKELFVVASSASSRVWIAAELLCACKLTGDSAPTSFLPSLINYIKMETSEVGRSLLSVLITILLNGAYLEETSEWLLFSPWCLSFVGSSNIEKIQGVFLRALVSLLHAVNTDKVWKKSDAEAFFMNLRSQLFIGSTMNRPCLKVIPFVLSVISGTLHEKTVDHSHPDPLQISSGTDVASTPSSNWLDKALSLQFPDLEDWTMVVLSCYPLTINMLNGKCEIEASRSLNKAEIKSLFAFFCKYQVLYKELYSSSYYGVMLPESLPMITAKLTAIAVGYCWSLFGEGDWAFVLHAVQKWIDLAVLIVEDIAELLDKSASDKQPIEDSLKKLNSAVQAIDCRMMSTAESAFVSLHLILQLDGLKETENFQTLQATGFEKFANVKDQMLGSVLRIFFATGVAESLAITFSEEASSIIALSRLGFIQLWGLVSSVVKYSPPHVRKSAVQSMELWGLSKGPVSALYALLFSTSPIYSLQCAANMLLSSDPVSQISIVEEGYGEKGVFPAQKPDSVNETTSKEDLKLRNEISSVIEKPISEIVDMDLMAAERVNLLLAWGLVLSHIQLLTLSSVTRGKIIQHIQDRASSVILDCIFQHIPLKTGAASGKKKDTELLPEAYSAVKACKDAILSCSIMPYVESLWPIQMDKMAALAGSIYGMMIQLLPSFVRTWFNGLRDRSFSYAVDAFTKECCSSMLLSNEFSQVKEMGLADDNFSVRVDRSAYKIVASYKKEEAEMDLVIRFPPSYPLQQVEVDYTRCLGISENVKRKWLLSLIAFVSNQNGAIAEAICMWKSNCDKAFEGVEECPICYSILHTSNHSLPRLACKTCKHKFHSACLYRWFSTSNKSTCPLCQTPF